MGEGKEVNIIENKCNCCGNEIVATVMGVNLCSKCIEIFYKYSKEVMNKKGV